LDFALSDEQLAFAELAKQILHDGATHERMKELEESDGPRFDAKLWKALASSGLLGIAIPEEHAGAGLSFFELSTVIEQVGVTTAPIPLIETLVLGALPIAEFGSETQQQAILPKVVEGEMILTAALVEAQADPLLPTTTARADGAGWKLDGRKLCVGAAQLADRILVPARFEEGSVGIFIVDPNSPGCTLDVLATTTGQPEASLQLADCAVTQDDLLGDATRGASILAWIRERATAALCSLSLGVCQEALRLTAEYTKTREQFGAAIATFQAVGQRLADAYVDTEAVRLTSWQAAWRIGQGMPATDQVAVAKYWASLAGQRVVHTAVHQHGGMGVDRDYPLHRHFLYAKGIELSLGGTTHQLIRIGDMLADPPA